MKKGNVRDLIIRYFSFFFSIFFVIILINTIFFNRTTTVSFYIPIILLGSIEVYLILFFLYCLYKKKRFRFLEYNPKALDIIVFLLVIFILQYIFAKCTYVSRGWDCGTIISSAFSLLRKEPFNIDYFSSITNNIGLLLVEKYLFTVVDFFTVIEDVTDAFFVATILNIIIVDLTSLFTFFTIKKLFGIKTAYLSLLFIFPFVIFFPYIIIPYTDVITMLFPILLLYLYLIIKELPKDSFKRYFLIFLEGVLLTIGFCLKPTVLIIIIAIVMMEILTMKSFNFKSILLVVIIFSMGFGLSYQGYLLLREKELGKYISQVDYYNHSYPITHLIMMGMKEFPLDGKMVYGSYYENDVRNTFSIIGHKEKEKYNLKVIKERLHDFGVFGYINFLYNKANWILSDGTFFYGGEGPWKLGDYPNQSVVARVVQNYVEKDTKEYQAVTANIMQILWILITVGLVFSFKRKENSNIYINISKLSIIGLVLFILIFEGRSRYLINYIPIFILVGTYGISNSFQMKKQ